MKGQIQTNNTSLPTLAEVVRQLLTIIPADKIFHKDGYLHIAIGEQTPRSLQQYKSILEGSDCAGSYTCALYAIADIRSGLESGSLFYTTVFVPEYQVYDNGQTTLPESLPRRLKRIRQQSAAEFFTGYKRSVYFLQGAQYFLTEQAPEMAAFMLHQSAELLLRGLHLAMTGKDLKTHLLSELVLHTGRYVPGLKDQCGPDIGKLEKAYTCSRYAPHYRIGAAEVSDCLLLITVLQQQIRVFFEQNLLVYEDVLLHDSVSETWYSPTPV